MAWCYHQSLSERNLYRVWFSSNQKYECIETSFLIRLTIASHVITIQEDYSDCTRVCHDFVWCLGFTSLPKRFLGFDNSPSRHRRNGRAAMHLSMHLSMQRLVLQAQSPRKPGLINLVLENGWKDGFQPLNSLQHVSSSMKVDPKWDECSIDADGVKHPWPMESLDST